MSLGLESIVSFAIPEGLIRSSEMMSLCGPGIPWGWMVESVTGEYGYYTVTWHGPDPMEARVLLPGYQRKTLRLAPGLPNPGHCTLSSRQSVRLPYYGGHLEVKLDASECTAEK